MVKGSDDCTPVEVEYILTFTDNRRMTISYETREMIATGKTERPSLSVVFDIHQETLYT